jgi:8-oxo-dGTP pyrophosphatase MutT (NUDIX family)
MVIDVAIVRRALLDHPGRPAEPPPSERFAAVAAVLRDGPYGAELLLIERAERSDDPWSGHMALPGGRRDPSDPDVLATALRETREEVGIDLARSGALLGRLDDLPAVARGKKVGLTIAPFVFALERDVALEPNHEVRQALWTALGPLYHDERAMTYKYSLGESVFELPAWDVEGRVVWGLTYRILKELFRVVMTSAPQPL